MPDEITITKSTAIKTTFGTLVVVAGLVWAAASRDASVTAKLTSMDQTLTKISLTVEQWTAELAKRGLDLEQLNRRLQGVEERQTELLQSVRTLEATIDRGKQ